MDRRAFMKTTVQSLTLALGFGFGLTACQQESKHAHAQTPDPVPFFFPGSIPSIQLIDEDFYLEDDRGNMFVSNEVGDWVYLSTKVSLGRRR